MSSAFSPPIVTQFHLFSRTIRAFCKTFTPREDDLHKVMDMKQIFRFNNYCEKAGPSPPLRPPTRVCQSVTLCVHINPPFCVNEEIKYPLLFGDSLHRKAHEHFSASHRVRSFGRQNSRSPRSCTVAERVRIGVSIAPHPPLETFKFHLKLILSASCHSLNNNLPLGAGGCRTRRLTRVSVVMWSRSSRSAARSSFRCEVSISYNVLFTFD